MGDQEVAVILSSLEKEKPKFRNLFDAINVAFHLCMKSLGFRCVGCGEVIDERENEKILPQGWDKSLDAYSFRYKHSQSSMTFLIKSIVMGEKLLVHGLAIEDNKIHTFEISPKNYINPNSLEGPPDSIYRDLKDLLSLFKINIVNKLLPTQKEGYEHTTTSTEQNLTSQTTSTSSSRLREGGPSLGGYDPDFDYDPLRVPGTGRGPRNPYVGGYPPNYSPYTQPQPYQPHVPFGIGGGDVFPSIPMGQPGFPTIPGNLVGPQHPHFGPYVTDPYGGFRGGRPPFRPPNPRIRFDPYGPPTGNNFGEPDNDELPPPGYNNMFL